MQIDWGKELEKFHYRDKLTEQKKSDLAQTKDMYQGLAQLVVARIPDCADKMAAIRALRESLHWCNNAIMQESNKEKE